MHYIPAHLDQRRRSLQRGSAVFAFACSVATVLVALRGSVDQNVDRALELHGFGSQIPLQWFFYIGVLQVASAFTAYFLTFLDSRYAIYTVIITISLSAVMHQFGGLSVGYGLVSLGQYAIYVVEGFILALLMLRSYSHGAGNPPDASPGGKLGHADA